NTQLFENSSLEVRACRPTEYSRKHSNIFKDLTGHEDTFVYALVMRAGDVFRGISEQETWETVEKCLQKSNGIEDFDIQSYYEYGDNEIYISRLEFVYQNYLFCVEMKRDYDWEAKENEFFNPESSVYITNLNQGADYTELEGSYIQIAESDNFGILDPTEDIPGFATLLRLEKNDEGYIATRYTYDDTGKWNQVEEWGFDEYPIGSNLQFTYSEDRKEWVSYLGEEGIYLTIQQNKNRLELNSDGIGVVYKKVDREIIK
ncbi:hypothetical protein, partial [Eubacterium ramulus]|uniref:hypothetical protein n=1 Tax=Eubacterium ramulus TaxID=39490 RepID=UPI00241E40F7